LHRSLIVTNDMRRFLRFGGIGIMVGHPGAAPGVSPIRTARIAVLLVPDEMDAHPGLAPGNSVLQTDGSTTLPCARIRMGRPTGAAPARRSSQDRMLAVTSRPPSEMDPPTGAAPAWSPLRKECIADLCHGGIENGAPARTCTSNLRLRRAACTILLHFGSEYPRQQPPFSIAPLV